MAEKGIPDIFPILRRSTKGPAKKAGWELGVQVTPKASHTKIGGIALDVDGRPYLKIYLTAAPEDNKANKALVALLAKTLRMPKSKFHIVSGLTDRRKVVWFRQETCAASTKDKWH